jgi:hypothetical protein
MSAARTLGNAIAGAAGAFFIVPVYALFHARSADEVRGRFWGQEELSAHGGDVRRLLPRGDAGSAGPARLCFRGNGRRIALSVRLGHKAAFGADA